ncbi:hypothetical protein PWY87_19765 [Kribbella solani]|uniref:hypothetical protein n=1 Tax=Kribbella solani TaxID=236067 RepID=UPI0029A58053|nr:hypothetical protein [Kribbella solani]MDX3003936.1 hypothetical protein [Kribbella solani]
MPVRLLAALFAAVAFLPALSVLPAHADTPELPDRIAAAWKTDHVSVDERLRPTMPASELARIRAAVKSAGFPVYVALVPQSPYLSKGGYDLPTLLHARVGMPGVYVIATVSERTWSVGGTLYRPAGLRGRDLYSVKAQDPQRLKVVYDRPAPLIVRTIQQAATAYDDRPLPAVPATDLRPDSAERGLSVTDKADRATFIGMGAGGFVGLVLTLVLGLRRRRGTVKREKSVAARPVDVRDVQLRADQKIQAAEGALARLDRRAKKSTQQLDRRDDAYRRLDAARTLRADQPEDLLACAGALVLARQAERVASGAALQPPCFFDPTHNPGTAKVGWSDDVEVPACQQCASIVARGNTPRGLRVPTKAGLFGHDTKQVPYWTLAPEDSPMVATGFGALSDDLPEQVVASRKDEVR